MSLLDEIKALNPGYNGVNNWTVLDEIEDVEEVYKEYLDSGRWTETHMSVFKRGDELVGLTFEVPATEMQEGGDFYHEAYAVEPYEVTETKYRRV